MVTLDDRNHGILLNFNLTSPLMTYMGYPVYAVRNPFSTSTTYPVLFMYFNTNLQGTGMWGWSVAAVAAPVSVPSVYYFALGAYTTPYDPSIVKAWVTGPTYPGGGNQAVYAVGCSGIQRFLSPRPGLCSACCFSLLR